MPKTTIKTPHFKLPHFRKPTPEKVIYRYLTSNARWELYKQLRILLLILVLTAGTTLYTFSLLYVTQTTDSLDVTSRIILSSLLLLAVVFCAAIFWLQIRCILNRYKDVQEIAAKCSELQHFTTASVSELRNSITELQSHQAERNANITALQNELNALQEQYNKDSKALQDRINEQQYDGTDLALAICQEILNLKLQQ